MGNQWGAYGAIFYSCLLNCDFYAFGPFFDRPDPVSSKKIQDFLDGDHPEEQKTLVLNIKEHINTYLPEFSAKKPNSICFADPYDKKFQYVDSKAALDLKNHFECAYHRIPFGFHNAIVIFNKHLRLTDLVKSYFNGIENPVLSSDFLNELHWLSMLLDTNSLEQSKIASLIGDLYLKNNHIDCAKNAYEHAVSTSKNQEGIQYISKLSALELFKNKDYLKSLDLCKKAINLSIVSLGEEVWICRHMFLIFKHLNEKHSAIFWGEKMIKNSKNKRLADEFSEYLNL